MTADGCQIDAAINRARVAEEKAAEPPPKAFFDLEPPARPPPPALEDYFDLKESDSLKVWQARALMSFQFPKQYPATVARYRILAEALKRIAE